MTKTLCINTEDKELTLKIGDELLKKLVGCDVLSLYEHELGDMLLFIDKVSITYDKNSLLVTNVN